MRIACLWTSLVLRFSVSSVHQILQLCFAGSAILCQFSTLDPAFVLRWFYDSLSVQYIRSCFSILQVCFANSSILRRFHFRNCTSFPVFHQFFNSLLASWILLRVSLILQFFASSARWSCILCRYSIFKVPYFYISGGSSFRCPPVDFKILLTAFAVNRFGACLLLFLCTENTTRYNAFARESEGQNEAQYMV